MLTKILPAIQDTALIKELAALERFQRIENDVLCRLASRASGCVVRDRWRAVWVLRDRLMPLPVSPMEGRAKPLAPGRQIGEHDDLANLLQRSAKRETV